MPPPPTAAASLPPSDDCPAHPRAYDREVPPGSHHGHQSRHGLQSRHGHRQSRDRRLQPGSQASSVSLGVCSREPLACTGQLLSSEQHAWPPSRPSTAPRTSSAAETTATPATSRRAHVGSLCPALVKPAAVRSLLTLLPRLGRSQERYKTCEERPRTADAGRLAAIGRQRRPAHRRHTDPRPASLTLLLLFIPGLHVAQQGVSVALISYNRSHGHGWRPMANTGSGIARDARSGHRGRAKQDEHALAAVSWTLAGTTRRRQHAGRLCRHAERMKPLKTLLGCSQRAAASRTSPPPSPSMRRRSLSTFAQSPVSTCIWEGGGQASRRWGGQGRSLAHVCRRAGMVGTQTAMLCNAPLLRSPSPGSWPGPPRSRCSTPERPAARRGRPAGKQRAARELVCVRRRTTAGFVEIALGGGQRTESIHPVWHQPSPLKYNGAPRTMGHPAQDQLWSPGGDHITHVVPAPSPSPLAPRAFL